MKPPNDMSCRYRDNKRRDYKYGDLTMINIMLEMSRETEIMKERMCFFVIIYNIYGNFIGLDVPGAGCYHDNGMIHVVERMEKLSQ